MPRFGFCDASYTMPVKYAASDRCMNWYPQTMEKGQMQGRKCLRQIPGMKDFGILPGSPVRNLFSVDGGNRLFGVGGEFLYEIAEDGTATPLGSVGFGTNPAIVAGNSAQLAISSGGLAYICDGVTVTPLVDSGAAPVTAGSIAFLNNYFIAAYANSREVRVSNLYPDGGIWDAADFKFKEGYPDNISRIYADNEQLWVMGFESSEIWVAGDGAFPFDRIQGAVSKIGCDAPWSMDGIGGIRFWLFRGVAFMASGTQPQPISDYAVEERWKSYGRAAMLAAEGWTYNRGKDIFWVISFPGVTEGGTWVYSLSDRSWHERGKWQYDGVLGRYKFGRYRGRVTANAFGKQIVGDYETGNLYELSDTTYTDAGGTELRRVRTAPAIGNEMVNIRHDRLQIDTEVGVGLDVADGDPGFDPQMLMRYSDDRGVTFGSELTRSLGKLGETKEQVYYDRLGSAKIGRTYEITVTDPVHVDIMDAFVNPPRGA